MLRSALRILPVALLAIGCGAEDPADGLAAAPNRLLPGPCVATEAVDETQVHYEYDLDAAGRTTTQRRFYSLALFDQVDHVFYFEGEHATGWCINASEESECERWTVDADGVPQSGTLSRSHVDMFWEGTIEFDAQGRRTRSVLHAADFPDRVEQTRTYVYAGNQVRIAVEEADGLTSEIVRVFDDAGRLQRENGRDFEYDAAGNLTLERTSNSTTTHTYDEHGNRLRTRVVMADGAVRSDVTYSFECFADNMNASDWISSTLF
jgi:YD repeat-containing protein